MKINFFGTAAAEGFPAIFCNCQYCAEARVRRGKNLRQRTQSLINDDLLIDISADTMSHFQMHDVRGDKLKYLLITHSHEDHFYPHELRLRGSCYAHNMEADKLNIVAPQAVFERCAKEMATMEKSIAGSLILHLAKPYETIHFDDYAITPLRARHAFSETAVIYIIEQGGKRILYAHDTGYFYDDVLEYLESKALRFDLITFDCTYAHLPTDRENGHMGLNTISELIETLRAMGAIDEETKLFVNHFSHNGNPLHEELSESAARIGCETAYDGCFVEV